MDQSSAAILAGSRDGNGAAGFERAHFERAQGLIGTDGLDLPTAALMALGGDDRITTDEQSGLNTYGCSPKPIPAISYASSTASTVSAPAFAHARAVHHQLQQRAKKAPAAAVYAEAMEQARERVRALYRTPPSLDVAFAASGTDLEYLALAIARRGGKRVRNIVVEVDEVGSGCLFAQAGQYFAPRTALGIPVQKGAPVPGFAEESIAVETAAVRAPSGELYDEAEREALLDRLIAGDGDAGERVILHVIHRSKTGLVSPPLAILDRLIERHGDRLDIVVDACQGRISPDALATYLDRGALVFLTGSKFIGGPPFSAIAFVPERMSERMRGGDEIAEGIGHFFTRAELPAHWSAADAILPAVPNFGLLLRIECALYELGRLFALPLDAVGAAIRGLAGALDDLPPGMPFRVLRQGADAEPSEHPLDWTMLHVLELTDPNPATGKPLTIEDGRALYEYLFTDISDRFSDPEDRRIAAEICHVGQPVRCLRNDEGAWAATLRLSLSAPHISDLAGLSEEMIRARFQTDVEWIGAKLKLAIGLLGDKQTKQAA